jgi:hypothetical protein
MTDRNGTKPGKIDQLQTIAGLVALGAGVLAVALVAGGALVAAPGSASSIASAAFGVIGSIVGAYFGVKIGSEGTQKAIQAQQAEATKAQVFAAHVPEAQADGVLASAESLVAATAGRSK